MVHFYASRFNFLVARFVLLYSFPLSNALPMTYRRDEASGKTGMDLIIQFIAQLLDPSQTESASLFVGDLISALIKKGGDLINSILPELLNAVTVRLTDAKLPSFIQVSAAQCFRTERRLKDNDVLTTTGLYFALCHVPPVAVNHGVCTIVP